MCIGKWLFSVFSEDLFWGLFNGENLLEFREFMLGESQILQLMFPNFPHGSLPSRI